KNSRQDSEALEGVDSVTAPDAKTVVLTLKAPNAQLLWNLTTRAGLVLDKDASYDAKTTAVGSGPYLVKSFRQNESLTLVANP
ncbi:ABC transporter substrate-binding protein, partial [Staphylococcus aureus]|uniref:ABC transporter substrate-binding protein n=1 Tax=Staphylococcus aureus TaxID=1280 RepID=UPI0038B40BF0